jgi:hypothetical protein
MAEPEPTPWWSNLVAVLVTAAVSIVATLFVVKSGGTPGAPSGPSGIGSFIKDTLIYMPHALLLYGVIADMLTYEGVYSIASLIGIFSLIIHFLFKFIWKGTFDIINKIIETVTRDNSPAAQLATSGRANKPTVIGATAPAPTGGAKAGTFFTTYTGCDVQGFDWAHSPYAPQTLVIIATIFSYYGIDLINNRGPQNAAVTIALGLVVYITQLFLAGDCSLPGEPTVSKWYQAILGAAEGLFVGGVSYTVVQAYFPNRLPSSTISPFPRMSPNMLKDGKFDKDGNPWVCVNGVCYPDMSSSESRKAFADIIAKSTGNGRAATAEDCPAK